MKTQLVTSVKQDGVTNKWQKRILKFLLNKIQLGDVDFSDENLNLSNVVSDKINDALTDLAKPSNKLFYIILGVHIVFLVLAIVLDKT